MSDCCSIKSPTEKTVTGTATPGTNSCLECGQPGKPIEPKTLKQMVQPWRLEPVSKPGFFFCRSADCDVVYFHPEGDCLRKPDVRVRVGLKETQDPVPVCYCFGFTEAMVHEDIQTTGKCTVPQRIAAEVKAGNCACEVRNPQGSCCLGNVTAAIRRAMKVAAAEKVGTLA